MSNAHFDTGESVGGILAVCVCGEAVDSFLRHFRDVGAMPRVHKGESNISPKLGEEHQRRWHAYTPEMGDDCFFKTWGDAMAWALMPTRERLAQIEKDFEMEGGW